MIPDSHKQITDSALKPYFSPQSLKLIERANIQTDDLKYQFIPAVHCTNGTTQENAKLIGNLQQITEDAFIKAANTDDATEKNDLLAKGSIALGMMCHSGQDQLAHSNEIDIFQKQRIDGDTFSKTNPFELEKLEGTKTCDFEVGKELAYIVGFSNKSKGSEFYVSWPNPQDSIPHWAMNLDKEGTVYDTLYKAKHGESGYKTAYKFAEEQTNAKWLETQEHLKKKLGKEKSDKLFMTLQTWDPSDDFLRTTFKKSRKKVETKVPILEPDKKKDKKPDSKPSRAKSQNLQ